MQRMTIAQAADALRLSRDTIRRKLKRGEIKAHRANDGSWLVEVEAPAPAALLTQPMQQPPMQPDAPLVQELRDRIGELKAELERVQQAHREELGALRAEHREERQQLLAMLERATTPRPGTLDRLLSWLQKSKPTA